MKQQNVLATIVAYYLSKFDEVAYANLGYKTKKEAHLDIGRKLNVNPNSVKNRRDEFDPIHSNERVGWHQRDMSPSRKRIVETFQDLSERGLREIAMSILKNQSFIYTETFEIITNQIQNAETDKKHFHLRGQTGRKAEELYINYHREFGLPQAGNLMDTRDLGCGYDFEIITSTDNFFIEIKGMDKNSSGILFTDKEWSMANKHGDKYYLVIVTFVSGKPEFSIIKNPAARLNPRKNLFTTVQINWSIPNNDLRQVIPEIN
jgi:hypothetical protein